MHPLRQKLVQFFYGRYGLDQCYYGLLGLFAVLFFVQTLTGWDFLVVPSTVVIVYALFRCLSKNHAARRRENEKFLRLWRPIKTELTLTSDRFRDRKTACYRHCAHCKAILKLPRKKGSHTVICPKCGKRFGVHILF